MQGRRRSRAILALLAILAGSVLRPSRGAAQSASEFEALKKEVQELRRRDEEQRKKLEELERKLDDALRRPAAEKEAATPPTPAPVAAPAAPEKPAAEAALDQALEQAQEQPQPPRTDIYSRRIGGA